MEIATCEAIAANVVRVQQAEVGTANWGDVWIAFGDHRFGFADTILVGQPIEGMQVVLDQPLDLGETSRIAVAVERWSSEALERANDYSELLGLPEQTISFNFEVAKMTDLWLRGDLTMDEEPCD